MLNLPGTGYSPSSHIGIYDLTVHLSSEADPEYVEALQDKMQTTSDIVKAFVSISSQSHSGPSNEEMLKRCQEAETEVRIPLLRRHLILTSYSAPLFGQSCLLYARDCVTQSRRGKAIMSNFWPRRNGLTAYKASHWHQETRLRRKSLPTAQFQRRSHPLA